MYDRPSEKGYAIYRDGELVVYAPTKRAAKALKGQLNGAAQHMRWIECVEALENAEKAVAYGT